MNPDDFIHKMRRMMGHSQLQVTRTVQATEEEVLEMMALEGYRMNAEKAAGLLRAKTQNFWTKIELRIGEVTSPLEWDDKEGKIKVMKEVITSKEADDGFPD